MGGFVYGADDGFVFQDEYLAKLRKLTDEEPGQLVRAAALACDFIRADVDRIEEQYRLKCETNRRNRLGNEEKASSSANAVKKGRPSTIVPEDKVKEKVKEKAEPCDDHHHPDTEVLSAESGDALLRKAHSVLSGLTDTHEAALREYREKLGDELVNYAIDRTVANGAKGWAYTETILADYLRRGFRNVQEAQAADGRYKASRARPRDRPGKTGSTSMNTAKRKCGTYSA